MLTFLSIFKGRNCQYLTDLLQETPFFPFRFMYVPPWLLKSRPATVFIPKIHVMVVGIEAHATLNCDRKNELQQPSTSCCHYLMVRLSVDALPTLEKSLSL